MATRHQDSRTTDVTVRGQNQILLMWNPHRCNHGYIICVECADSWELDQHVH
ncbi:hypothetical protein ACFYT3_22500 [Nocardia amikacinitolerans]|uniref:hypothetical protein n=1 Tax=Nocardia amikacinitolerans TaxID=756689 RepID=UPI0036AE88B2